MTDRFALVTLRDSQRYNEISHLVVSAQGGLILANTPSYGGAEGAGKSVDAYIVSAPDAVLDTLRQHSASTKSISRSCSQRYCSWLE